MECSGFSWNCYKTLAFCSLLTRCTIPCTCHAKRHLNVKKWSEPVSFLHFWLGNLFRATTVYTFSTSERQKVVRTRQFFTLLTWKRALRRNGGHFFDMSTPKSGPNMVCFVILTWKCASRHSGVHFFDIWTCKSVPKLKCFLRFDFKMCVAPQRRAIFHLSSGQLAPHPPL